MAGRGKEESDKSRTAGIQCMTSSFEPAKLILGTAALTLASVLTISESPSFPSWESSFWVLHTDLESKIAGREDRSWEPDCWTRRQIEVNLSQPTWYLHLLHRFASLRHKQMHRVCITWGSLGHSRRFSEDPSRIALLSLALRKETYRQYCLWVLRYCAMFPGSSTDAPSSPRNLPRIYALSTFGSGISDQALQQFFTDIARWRDLCSITDISHVHGSWLTYGTKQVRLAHCDCAAWAYRLKLSSASTNPDKTCNPWVAVLNKSRSSFLPKYLLLVSLFFVK